MKNLLTEVKKYISTHRQESTIIGGVLAVIILASVGIIYTSTSESTISSSKEEIKKETPTPTTNAKKRPSPKPTSASPTPTKTPTRTPTKADTNSTIGIKATNTPTPKTTATSPPTNTPIPNTPTNTPTHTPSPSPTLAPDTTPPSLKEMTGPKDGETITFRSFCFPMQPIDDRSVYPQIKTQFKFDSSEWTAWGTDVSPCYSDVADGQHTFSVQLKDEANNMSTITRTFTVDAE